ncbi:MAG: prepilin peptidase [Chloroflexi bacterium]|nr:prepilin peptidase [Chloroflexota bacterium]
MEHLPLQRFLPPLSRGAMAYGLSQMAAPGSWIIDPFGASPQLALETAQAGYKTLVICNNPILQFYIELLCSAPKREDFYAALADFAIEKQDDVRLETTLQSLYQTRCPHCGDLIPAQSYIWRKDQNQLKSKNISCRTCGTEGEFPVDAEDIQRLSSSSLDALHRARALQRVNISPDVLKAAEDVSQVYTTRSLNFIFTFLNRIERMDTSAYHKKLLYAILIFLLDEGNSMWTWPASKARPKILSTPGQFREQNLWLIMDKAIEQWCSVKNPLPFSVWPEIPQGETGICLYKGRISGFRSEHPDQPVQFAAACTAFPRPNQAFWSLTAVWSGWLWGKNAVLPMKSALERRRFDWYWYTAAVHQTLSGLHEILAANIPFLGAVSEAEIAFVASTFFAAENSGLTVKSCAMRADEEIIQIIWEKDGQGKSKATSSVEEVYLDSMKNYLLARNEPADELEVTTACLFDISRNKLFPMGEDPIPYHAIKDIQQEISTLLNETDFFTRLTVQHGSQEKQIYWPAANSHTPRTTLSDHVEIAFYEMFSKTNQLTYMEVDRGLCSQFPGLLTPSKELVKMLIHSYTETSRDQTGSYVLKNEIKKSVLEKEQQKIIGDLAVLGTRLGYFVQAGQPLIWKEENDSDPVITFTVITTTAISQQISAISKTGLQVVIYPNILSELLEYKTNHNPLLASSLGEQVKILHYQKILDLCQTETLQRSDFFTSIEESQHDHQQPSQISFFPT